MTVIGSKLGKQRHNAGTAMALLLLTTMNSGAVIAQETNAAAGPAQNQVVVYTADHFAKYQPETALDMVEQVPGFQLDDGSSTRGFGAAAGNVLIDGRRPTAKQDKPSATLNRIPASLVNRIELVRGQMRGIDLVGQSSIVNVVLMDDLPAAVYWELLARHNFDIPPVTTIGSVALTDNWRDIEYNAGAFLRIYSNGDPGTEQVFDGTGNLTEERVEPQKDTGYETRGNLGANAWVGETLLSANTSVIFVDEDSKRPSYRVSVPEGISNDVLIAEKFTTLKVELGLDAERQINDALIAKGILLYNRSEKDSLKSQRNIGPEGAAGLLKLADTDSVSQESIARLEFNWSRWADHTIQINLEGAFNVLDNALLQTQDTGSGPVIIDVPGANTRVEELRGNFLVKDTWTFGMFELDYGFGVEVSTISQTGDAEQTRHFTYLKPQSVLSYSPARERQTRLRIAREVSQLDFADFVSAANFEDDDLDFGNPDLQPETSWIAELSHEWRQGAVGVVKLTAFHHWISDVEDLLPLTSDFEVPGNIGDGRRWGMILETTVPMDRIGLPNAKLDFQARYQDSVVTDPVTGNDRVLSDDGLFGTSPSFENENKYAFGLFYRQDFSRQRTSWGWSFRTRAERPVFKVNELDIYNEDAEYNIFVETTRWFGIKMRLDGLNVTNHIETRDRTVYEGERDLSSVAFRELTDAYNGARIMLTLSGSF
jgi:hypothetical protein